jgi:hypothetical protein
LQFALKALQVAERQIVFASFSENSVLNQLEILKSNTVIGMGNMLSARLPKKESIDFVNYTSSGVS